MAEPRQSVPPTPESALEERALHRRLTILTALRLAIVTALLGATIYVTVRPNEELGSTLDALLYGLVAFIYAASIGYLWALRTRRALKVVAFAQVAGDLLVATFLVYLTGGAESIFTLMYPLAIVNGSIVLSRSGALIAGFGGALLFAALAILLAFHLVPPPAPFLAQSALPLGRLAYLVTANALAFLLTAALATYLAEQLRRTGESLREREVDYAALSELHTAIVRSMSAGIVTTDRAGKVTFVNPAAESILGRAFGELYDRPLDRELPALSTGVEAALKKGLFRGEVDENDAKGEARRLTFVVNPMTRAGPRRRGSRIDPGYAVVFEDLTELRGMQEAVRRADRLAAVGELAAGLAHELRNPLAAMTGAVELMGRSGAVDESHQRLFEIVTREGERLDALVTDFLAFARPQPPAWAPADLAALADETLRVFEHSPLAQGVVLSRRGEVSLRLFCDPGQLKQVLWNLLANAAEAVAGRGSVAVEVGWSREGWARLKVSDTGPGIAEADRPRLFEPFFTTKPTGTGLGLANVHRIVEAHGGHVEVESRPGATSFAVVLPVAAG